ncbi:MAG: beta-propeller domain-containing protein, partial [Nitrosopumilaceae archaeon]
MKNASRYAIYSVIAIAAASAIGFVVMTNVSHTDQVIPEDKEKTTPEITTPIESTQDLKKFSSADELRKFLLDAQTSFALQYPGNMMFDEVMPRPIMADLGREGAPVMKEQASPTSGGDTYSTTNVQVSNVDEPDFLKNDGKYAYIVSEDKLTIIEAYPADSAKQILKIGLDVQGQYLQNMFLNKDRLVIFYSGSGERYSIQQYDFIPRPIYMPTTHALVMDVSDKENPKILKDYEVNGNYYNARMIGNYVYFIVNNGVDYRDPILPVLKESLRIVMVPDVYYFDNPEQYY